MKYITSFISISVLLVASAASAAATYTLDLQPEPAPSKTLRLNFTSTKVFSRRCPITVEGFELTSPNRKRDGQIDITTGPNDPRMKCPAVMGKRTGGIDLDSTKLVTGKYRVFVDGQYIDTIRYARALRK